MAVESAADRLAFLNPDEFGATATITPLSGLPVLLSGIFDNEYLLLGDAGGLEGVSGSSPVFLVRRSDVASVSLPGASIVINIDGVETSFKIVEIRPDGTGMVQLRLHEAT